MIGILAVLKLHPHHLQAIRIHAESTYPEECCGLLLGKLAEDGKTVVEVMPTQNIWNAEAVEAFQEIEGSAKLGSDKRDRYAIAPEDMLKAQKQARGASPSPLDIIGIYHSHPDHPAIPSEFDRACAWSVYSYIIVSVQQSKAGDLRNWSLDDAHQFQPEEMITVEIT
ncbi:M67 family metallopeptidase [Coleofasciculus sp. FACHB-1120]|uniref:Mov34/MPN/PAD-1 family protein n=1 Tax=Coleofasciculus sp. FACHB-1120 TaxID=2692783 RepID=UPI00168753F5|nr:M67 family metallopeptidase [Coleofasciculus sp. FACHB-1120]